MQYALLVKSHANVRYAQSMLKLAAQECGCMLHALHIEADVRTETVAGNPFLILETDVLDEESWAYLSRMSAIALAALKDGEWLKPLPLRNGSYLASDLSQVLKYKGKTNADFTAMMLHCARSASAFALSRDPLWVLDPVCGRGTSLFCALEEGECAIGIEMDEKALHEADVYMQHYLQYHRYKHNREEHSLTLRSGGATRERRFTLANDTDAYKRGDTRTLRLLHGDSAQADEMLGTSSCHLIIGDLPYGVQHAPKEGKEISSLTQLLERTLPAYRRVLMSGGAIALSFNTYTLPRATVVAAMRKAGFQPLVEPPFNDFTHWVEQAVNRDMVVAIRA